MIAQVALDLGEERLGGDLGVGQPVHGAIGSLDTEIAIVVVDLHHLRHVDLVAEREEDRLVLLVVHEIGGRLVVADRHPGHDRRLQHGTS